MGAPQWFPAREEGEAITGDCRQFEVLLRDTVVAHAEWTQADGSPRFTPPAIRKIGDVLQENRSAR